MFIRLPLLDFLKNGNLPKDKIKPKEIMSMAEQYMIQGDELYKKIALGHGLLYIDKEYSIRVIYDAYKGECGYHLSRRKLS